MPSQPSELSHRLMQAGAGAGKTTTLIRTFMDFTNDFRARHQGEFPRIVITTFTRKATQEVKERLLRKALEMGDEEIFRFLSQRSRVHVSTIHGVLSLFLSRFGSRIGLPADFKVVGADEIRWLGRRELRRILADGDAESLALLEDHSFSELWLALEEWREGVGSYGEIKAASEDDFRAQTLKFLKDFAAEAKYVAAGARNSSKNEKWLEWSDLLDGLSKIPHTDDEIEAYIDRLVDLDSWIDRPRVAAGKTKLVDEAIGERFKAMIEDYWKPLTETGKSEKYRPSYWKRHTDRTRVFENLAQVYRRRLDLLLLDRGLLSMSDLEQRSLEIIRQDPEAAQSFSLDWDYWMIDEYQDTSPLQVELLKALVGERPHFVVGDPQQSIYFFRGARSEVFFDKKKQFEDQSALVQHVRANYRSRAPLLEFLNDFFGDRPGFSAMDPQAVKEAAREVPVADFRVMEPGETEEVCTLAVVERIQELIAEGAAPETICVLARRNSDLKKVLEESRRRHIPVQLHTAGGFARRREVRDAVGFLKFLLNPSDNLNFLSLLRSPWFHLSDEAIAEFCVSRPTSYWVEACRRFISADSAHPVQRLKMWLDEADRLGLSGTLRQFYRTEGLLDSASLADPSGRREANLWKFLVQLEAAQRRPGFNGLAFARDLDRALSTEEGNEDGDAVPAVEPKRVNLMTVHASKGLEFEHVIVTHLHGLRGSERTELFQFDEDDGLWTLAEKNLTGSKVGSLLAKKIIDTRNQRMAEESVRVLYVALTRAMKSVTFVWEKSRMWKDARSWASLVNVALTDGLHDSGKYIYRVRSEAPNPAAWSVVGNEVAELRPRLSPPAKTTLAHVSPTELVEKAMQSDKQELADRGSVAAAAGLRVAQRGTDAHRLFESLKYTDEARVRAMTNDQELLKGMDWLLAQTNPPFRQIIDKGEAEWGFAVRGEGFILQGQIDLWSDVDGTIWLVDYKTGSQAHSEKALDQLALYAWALKRLKKMKDEQPVHLVAVYPLEEKVISRSYRSAIDLQPVWKSLLPAAPVI